MKKHCICIFALLLLMTPPSWSGEIERIQEKKRSFAHVHMQLEFLDAESEKTLVRYEEEQRLELTPTNDMNTFAQATSAILTHLTDEFLQQVVQYLKERRALEIE